MDRRYVWMAVVAVTGLGIAGACGTKMSSDEPPIYVLNGSLDFKASSGWSWKAEASPADSYSHEPASPGDFPNSNQTLYVKVNLNSGSCTGGNTASGNNIVLTYAETGGGQHTFTMNRAGQGNRYRTKVRPGQGLTANGGLLRYGANGYLESIRLGGWLCDNLTAAMLDRVAICASGNATECK